MKHYPETAYRAEHYVIHDNCLAFFPRRPSHWSMSSKSPQGYRIIELLFGSDDFYWLMR